MFGRAGWGWGGGSEGREQQGKAQPQGYYETLGVNSGASADEIRAAWAKKVKQFHTDRQAPGMNNSLLDEQLRYVNVSYDVLKTSRLKNIYDQNPFLSEGERQVAVAAEQRRIGEERIRQAEDEARRKASAEGAKKAAGGSEGRVSQEEAARREQAEKQAREQAERERKAREEAQRQAREQAEQAERERRQQEEAARRRQEEAKKQTGEKEQAGPLGRRPETEREYTESRGGYEVKFKNGKVHFFDSKRGVEGKDGYEDIQPVGRWFYGVEKGKKYFIDPHSGASSAEGGDDIEIRNSQPYIINRPKAKQPAAAR